MAVKNILPSLQADEKSAQLHVRALPMPNMLGNAGSLLSDAGNNLQGLGAKLALAFKAEHDRQNEQASRIRQNSDKLKLNERINAYRNFVTTNYDEFSKLKGAQADGSTDKFIEAIGKKRDYFTVNLNQEQLREFNLEAAQIDFAARRNMLNHEDSNVREANIQSNQLSIQNISANYARTGDPENMPQLYRAIEGLYRATYGDVPTDDTRITELLMTKDALEREGGKEEEVAKVDKELENLGMRTNAFYDMRDAIVEQMFSARFDYLEKQGNLVEARKFYYEHEDRLSEPTKNRMLKVLEDTERRQSHKDLAGVLVNYVTSAGEVDSMYWTPEMTEQAATLIEDLQRRAIDDPNAAEVLEITKTLLENRERAGKAKFASDFYAVTKDLEFNPNDIIGLGNNLEKLQDVINRTSSPLLKRELKELQIKYQQHYNSALKSAETANENTAKAIRKDVENDPIHKRAVTMFMVAAGMHEKNFVIRWGDVDYDLKTAAGLNNFLTVSRVTYDDEGNPHGLFTEKEAEEFAKMVNSPTNTYFEHAAEDLVAVINNTSGSKRKISVKELIDYAPELIDEVLKWRAVMSEDGKLKRGGDLDNDMLKKIATQNTRIEDKWFWVDSNQTFAERIGEFFEGVKEGEVEINKKIAKHKASYEFNKQDEVHRDLNAMITSVSTLPDAKAIFYDVASEAILKLVPEGYDPSGQQPFDYSTNVWDIVKLPTKEEKEAKAKAEAEAEAEKKRKNEVYEKREKEEKASHKRAVQEQASRSASQSEAYTLQRNSDYSNFLSGKRR